MRQIVEELVLDLVNQNEVNRLVIEAIVINDLRHKLDIYVDGEIAELIRMGYLEEIKDGNNKSLKITNSGRIHLEIKKLDYEERRSVQLFIEKVKAKRRKKE